jgi:glycosyltransferase involved in cell wall biosynthesis
MTTSGSVRLLFAVDVYPDRGGIQAIVENCVAALVDHYDVHLAIVDERKGSRAQIGLPDDHVHALTTRHRLKPYLMPTSLVYPIRVSHFLRALVRKLHPVVLLAQDGLFLPVPALLATRGTPTSVIVMDHGTLTNSLDPRWQRMLPKQLPFPQNLVYRVGFALDRPWRSLRWRIGLRGADAVWYVGEELAPWIARAGARSARYKQVVPTDFRPAHPDERTAARRQLGIRQDARVVNMVTRLSGEKDLPAVVAAVEALRGMHPGVLLVIAGDGPLELWLRTELDKRGLSRVVRLVGRLDRAGIQRLHHGSDFHLYAGTIGCGMSIALLEAMAAGVLPIVSDVPREQRDLVGDAGWVFAAGDARALEESLAAALSADAAEREQRKRSCQKQLASYLRPSLRDLLADLLGDAAETPQRRTLPHEPASE